MEQAGVTGGKRGQSIPVSSSCSILEPGTAPELSWHGSGSAGTPCVSSVPSPAHYWRAPPQTASSVPMDPLKSVSLSK